MGDCISQHRVQGVPLAKSTGTPCQSCQFEIRGEGAWWSWLCCPQRSKQTTQVMTTPPKERNLKIFSSSYADPHVRTQTACLARPLALEVLPLPRSPSVHLRLADQLDSSPRSFSYHLYPTLPCPAAFDIVNPYPSPLHLLLHFPSSLLFHDLVQVPSCKVREKICNRLLLRCVRVSWCDF